MRFLIAISLLIFVFGVWTTSSRSEVIDPLPARSPETLDEPLTGERVMPKAGDEAVVKDPFTPYGIGPADQAIALEQLSHDDQVAATRVRNQSAAQLERYRQAAVHRSARITADVAAHQLGIDQLQSLGVVP
jgi:hypothetical protein